MSWQGPGSILQQSAVVPALVCGDEEMGGYFLCRPWSNVFYLIILVFFAVLTFMQILISVSLASAASIAKVLQESLQARPLSCLILC